MAGGRTTSDRWVHSFKFGLVLVTFFLTACSAFSGRTSEAAPETLVTVEGQLDTGGQTENGRNDPIERLTEDVVVGDLSPAVDIHDSSISCVTASDESGEVRTVSSVTNLGDDRGQYWFSVSIYDGDRRVGGEQNLAIDHVLPGATGRKVTRHPDLLFAETQRCEAISVRRSGYIEPEIPELHRDHAGPCSVMPSDDYPDTVDISFTITNSNDVVVTYLIDVSVYDADWNGLETLKYARQLSPGESIQESQRWNYEGFDLASLSCEIADFQASERRSLED